MITFGDALTLRLGVSSSSGLRAAALLAASFISARL
jgi:hypothetical protein